MITGYPVDWRDMHANARRRSKIILYYRPFEQIYFARVHDEAPFRYHRTGSRRPSQRLMAAQRAKNEKGADKGNRNGKRDAQKKRTDSNQDFDDGVWETK